MDGPKGGKWTVPCFRVWTVHFDPVRPFTFPQDRSKKSLYHKDILTKEESNRNTRNYSFKFINRARCWQPLNLFSRYKCHGIKNSISKTQKMFKIVTIFVLILEIVSIFPETCLKYIFLQEFGELWNFDRSW